MKIMSAKEAKEASKTAEQKNKQRALESLEKYIPREIKEAVQEGKTAIEFVIPYQLEYADCSEVVSQLRKQGYIVNGIRCAGESRIMIKWGDE